MNDVRRKKQCFRYCALMIRKDNNLNIYLCKRKSAEITNNVLLQFITYRKMMEDKSLYCYKDRNIHIHSENKKKNVPNQSFL